MELLVRSKLCFRLRVTIPTLKSYLLSKDTLYDDGKSTSTPVFSSRFYQGRIVQGTKSIHKNSNAGACGLVYFKH